MFYLGLNGSSRNPFLRTQHNLGSFNLQNTDLNIALKDSILSLIKLYRVFLHNLILPMFSEDYIEEQFQKLHAGSLVHYLIHKVF